MPPAAQADLISKESACWTCSSSVLTAFVLGKLQVHGRCTTRRQDLLLQPRFWRADSSVTLNLALIKFQCLQDMALSSMQLQWRIAPL